ncbi:MAG: aldo/keto reductase [Rhodoferax sp.]|nr:aldo/keto reductase [Rhodoferax sp.]
MKKIQLGRSDLAVTPICLGTMTFGEQVDEPLAHQIMARSLERGVDFMDTAEMYSVPTRAETFGATETIIGNYFARNPGVRRRWTLASKVAGPSRGMNWVRGGSDNVTAADIVGACEDSLRRLQTDVIDLYQIHWPVRHVPAFGNPYFDPAKDRRDLSTIREQLEGLARLVKAGKVREIGLSNETPWGVMEFVRVAAEHGLPRVVSVQNTYCLINRAVDNGLDEVLYREQVGLLAYSPLGFGQLTGKYDDSGHTGPGAPQGSRLQRYESVQKGRWGRPESLAAARRYNALARRHGLSPTRMALAFCYTNWRVASTLLGVTSVEQLDECLDAWGTTLSPELLTAIDAVRWEIRDPAT